MVYLMPLERKSNKSCGKEGRGSPPLSLPTNGCSERSLLWFRSTHTFWLLSRKALNYPRNQLPHFFGATLRACVLHDARCTLEPPPGFACSLLCLSKGWCLGDLCSPSIQETLETKVSASLSTRETKEVTLFCHNISLGLTRLLNLGNT